MQQLAQESTDHRLPTTEYGLDCAACIAVDFVHASHRPEAVHQAVKLLNSANFQGHDQGSGGGTRLLLRVDAVDVYFFIGQQNSHIAQKSRSVECFDTHTGG